MENKNQEVISEHYKEAVKGIDQFILEDVDRWYGYVVELPEDLKITYTIVVFHQQVFNGGLHQYFFNGYGLFGYLTIGYLKLIKAFVSAEILKEAVSQVNTDKLEVGEFRKRIFSRQLLRVSEFDKELSDFLDGLDDRYYSLDEDLEKLLGSYLQGKK